MTLETLRKIYERTLATPDAQTPGNAAECMFIHRTAVIMADGNTITAEDLGLTPVDEAQSFNLRQVRDEAERQAVLKVMARVDGNIAKAAEQGLAGDPGQYRDLVIPRPGYRPMTDAAKG